MTKRQAISAFLGVLLLACAAVLAEEPSTQPSIQVGQWQCGTLKGYRGFPIWCWPSRLATKMRASARA